MLWFSAMVCQISSACTHLPACYVCFGLRFLLCKVSSSHLSTGRHMTKRTIDPCTYTSPLFSSSVCYSKIKKAQQRRLDRAKIVQVLRLSNNAELGIDVPSILRRSRGILFNRLGANEMLSLDLGGPLIFDILLACTHLLVRLALLGGRSSKFSGNILSSSVSAVTRRSKLLCSRLHFPVALIIRSDSIGQI